MKECKCERMRLILPLCVFQRFFITQNLRFTTRRAFGIREREVFAFVRMGKFEVMMADFAKELLVTVFVMTVFVQAGGTAFGTREC
jgi:hypothetical protein